MEQNIVYAGKTSKEREIIIRYPTLSDAPEMWRYINELSQEKTFVRFQGEEISLEYETKFLNGGLEKIKNKRAVQLLVFSSNTLIGISAIDLKDKSESHEGVFGLSVAKDFRGEGIGKLLMKLTIDEAVNKLSDLRIITLGVFGDNDLAYTLYEKLGFKEFGRLPGGSKHRDKYVDHIYMYKEVQRDE